MVVFAGNRCRWSGLAVAADLRRPLFTVHRCGRCTISVTGGVTIGLIAGYFRGVVDTIIMRIMDVILAFPSLLLALVLVAILGPGLMNAMIAIAIVLQPHFVRLTRASVMSELNREYVISARVAGASPFYLMTKTILPNCLGPVTVQATLVLFQCNP